MYTYGQMLLSVSEICIVIFDKITFAWGSKRETENILHINFIKNVSNSWKQCDYILKLWTS